MGHHHVLAGLVTLPFIIGIWVAFAFIAMFGFVVFIVVCGVAGELVMVEVRKRRSDSQANWWDDLDT